MKISPSLLQSLDYCSPPQNVKLHFPAIWRKSKALQSIIARAKAVTVMQFL